MYFRCGLDDSALLVPFPVLALLLCLDLHVNWLVAGNVGWNGVRVAFILIDGRYGYSTTFVSMRRSGIGGDEQSQGLLVEEVSTDCRRCWSLLSWLEESGQGGSAMSQ